MHTKGDPFVDGFFFSPCRVTRFDILHKGIKAKESVPGLCLSRTCLDLIPSQQHRHPVSCHEAALAYFPALRCPVGGLQDCNPRIRGQALWLTLAMTFLLASPAMPPKMQRISWNVDMGSSVSTRAPSMPPTWRLRERLSKALQDPTTEGAHVDHGRHAKPHGET